MENLLNGFNVPSHKADISRPNNLLWIIENLHVRNSQHPKFQSTMTVLLQKAKEQNLLCDSELKRLSKTPSEATQ